ncbi:MAG: hypothetical protein ABIO70_36275 [Pseudomonadota bacterium]
MRALALLALCLPTTALAKTHYESLLGGVKDVALDGVVEVPLAGNVYGDELPYVWVKMSPDDEEKFLFLVDLGSDQIYVDPGFAEEQGDGVHTKNKAFFASLGLKKDKAVYKAGGKIEQTHIDELHIGGLALSGVTALVGPADTAPLYFSQPGPGTVRGVIGAGALGAATAILPSEGVVRFAPADQGEALLQQVGGTVVPFHSSESEFVKTWQGKFLFVPRYLLVDAKVGEEPLTLELRTRGLGSLLDRSVAIGDAPTHPVGDRAIAWVSPRIGDLDLGPDWVSHREYTAAEHPAGKEGRIEYNFLGAYDLALDPGTSQIALRPATAWQREPTIQAFIDRKVAEIAEIDAPNEDGTPQEKDEDQLKADNEKRAGLLATKGDFERVAGQVEAAVADLEQSVSIDPDPCENWLKLSVAYQYAGRFDDAAVAAQKGLDRYQAWASLSKDEREEIEKLEDEEREASGVQPQDLDACHVAAGVVAYYELAAGEAAQAEAMWVEHQDLDPTLGVVAGVAYLLDGQPDKAQGPLRFALNRAAPAGVAAAPYVATSRIALAEVYRQAGDLDTALAHWEKEQIFLQNDPFAIEQYAELVRGARGEAAVIEALRSMATAYPDNPMFSAVLARELAARGQDVKAKGFFDTAGAQIEHLLAVRPLYTPLHGVAAWYNVLAGKPEAAKAEAEKALAADPTDGYAHWALMSVAQQAGDIGTAVSHWKLARAYHMGHYFFASLAEPVAPPAPAPVEGAGEETAPE